jgi:hypothetical protein
MMGPRHGLSKFRVNPDAELCGHTTILTVCSWFSHESYASSRFEHHVKLFAARELYIATLASRVHVSRDFMLC